MFIVMMSIKPYILCTIPMFCKIINGIDYVLNPSNLSFCFYERFLNSLQDPRMNILASRNDTVVFPECAAEPKI